MATPIDSSDGSGDARGRFVATWPMADEIGLALIRLWCEVLEDANPLYYDDEFARQSRYAGIIAPPTMLMPLCQRPEWTPIGNAPSTLESLHLSLPDYPNAASLKTIQTYQSPLRLGDRPTIHLYETDPTPEQMTTRGPGRIVTRYFSFRDQQGQEIGSHQLEILRYRDHQGSSTPALQPVRPTASSGVELIRRPPEEGPRYWQDVTEGDEIGTLSIPLSLKRCIKWVAATRDFLEVHHDKDWARRAGADDIYIGVDFFHGLAGRYATDWAGPHGELRRLELLAFGRSHPGDRIQVSGRVGRKIEENDEGRVDLVISFANAREVTHEATVAVALPRS
jgi:hypothetical protein